MKKLAAFGDGFRLIKVGSAKMVVSVPVELNQDHMAVLAHAEVSLSEGQVYAEFYFF